VKTSKSRPGKSESADARKIFPENCFDFIQISDCFDGFFYPDLIIPLEGIKSGISKMEGIIKGDFVPSYNAPVDDRRIIHRAKRAVIKTDRFRWAC
jgi:hypothetical protein